MFTRKKIFWTPVAEFFLEIMHNFFWEYKMQIRAKKDFFVIS